MNIEHQTIIDTDSFRPLADHFESLDVLSELSDILVF